MHKTAPGLIFLIATKIFSIASAPAGESGRPVKNAISQPGEETGEGDGEEEEEGEGEGEEEEEEEGEGAGADEGEVECEGAGAGGSGDGFSARSTFGGTRSARSISTVRVPRSLSSSRFSRI